MTNGTRRTGSRRDPFAQERRIATLTAVAVVGLVMFLVIRNQPFADPDLVVALRIILSLAIGILGATIPGFLTIGYSVNGVMLRAGGALALFVLSFFGTPRVESLHLPQKPTIEMDLIRQVDFRTAVQPGEADEVRAQGETYATVPLALRSVKEPAATAILNRTSITFPDSSGQLHDFNWRNFVTMHEERYGVWLGIDEDAHPVSIEAGKSWFHEVLHRPVSSYKWSEFLASLKTSTSDTFDILVSADVSGQRVERHCRVDVKKWRSAVDDFEKKNHTLPGRVTMDCLP